VREQVVAHKVGNRSGAAGARRTGAAAQRPTRRDRDNDGPGIGGRLRTLVGYLPTFLKIVLAIGVGILVFASYREAASASFFQVRTVEVQGTSRVSANEVQALVRRDVDKTGVWNADLGTVTAHLERLPWVRTAVVSRVLPDGIRVRIAERVPRAVVRTASGRFRWIDEDAVLLGEMLPTDQLPAFFLRGLSEDEGAATRTENRERVQKFMELQREWDASGLSERVSEVNLIDIHDVRAQLAGDNSEIEVRLGSQDQGTRLKKALEVLDSQRQTPHGGLISYIDLSQGRRAIVGLVTGAQAAAINSAEVADSSANSEVEAQADTTPAGEAPGNNLQAGRDVSEATRTSDNKARARQERDKKRSTEKKPDKAQKIARRN